MRFCPLDSELELLIATDRSVEHDCCWFGKQRPLCMAILDQQTPEKLYLRLEVRDEARKHRRIGNRGTTVVEPLDPSNQIKTSPSRGRVNSRGISFDSRSERTVGQQPFSFCATCVLAVDLDNEEAGTKYAKVSCLQSHELLIPPAPLCYVFRR